MSDQHGLAIFFVSIQANKEIQFINNQDQF